MSCKGTPYQLAKIYPSWIPSLSPPLGECEMPEEIARMTAGPEWK